MKLFNLSFRNVRRSIRDYAVYFFTLVLGVSIFYVFNAVETQTAALMLSADTRDALLLLKNIINGLSVFVAFILGFLIVYASRFLIKRRNKEFAIYLLLGMGKGTVAWVLFLETLLIGFFSLGTGLGAGLCLSQVMSAVVAQLFEADMSSYVFVFSRSAFFKTILYFSVIMAVTVVFDLFMVGKCKIIDLMQTGLRAEKVRIKTPVLCIVIFFASAAALGHAYYMVLAPYAQISRLAHRVLVASLIGAVSTFLLIWSAAGLLLGTVSSMKNVYFKRLNCFTFRQVSNRVNTMTVSMSVICLMLFATIGILSTALSLRSSMNRNLQDMAPADIEIRKSLSQIETRSDFLESNPEASEEFLEMDVVDALKATGFDITEHLSEYVQFTLYATEDLTFGDSLGETLAGVQERVPNLSFRMREPMIKISDYNRIAKLFGEETYELASNEYIMLCDYKTMILIRNGALAAGTKISVFGKELSPKFGEVREGFVEFSSARTNSGVVIVPDDVPDENYGFRSYITGNYGAENEEAAAKIEQDIINAGTHFEETTGWILGLNTRRDIRSSEIGLGAVVTFIGLYLGLVFLVASAAIIALKALTDCIDSQKRYQTLRRIGADEKDILHSLRCQEGLLFLLPLAFACIHSVVGIRFSSELLESIGTGQMFDSILLTAIIIVIIYGGYFVITYSGSKRMIKGRL